MLQIRKATVIVGSKICAEFVSFARTKVKKGGCKIEKPV
jgi:hypothetical protein